MYLWVSFLPGFLRSVVIYEPPWSCTLKLLSALDMLQSRSAVFEFLASSDLTFSGSPFPNAKENWFTLPVQWNSWRLMAWPLRRHKETKGIMQLSLWHRTLAGTWGTEGCGRRTSMILAVSADYQRSSSPSTLLFFLLLKKFTQGTARLHVFVRGAEA